MRFSNARRKTGAAVRICSAVTSAFTRFRPDGRLNSISVRRVTLTPIDVHESNGLVAREGEDGVRGRIQGFVEAPLVGEELGAGIPVDTVVGVAGAFSSVVWTLRPSKVKLSGSDPSLR
jgi:hypothetical protein